MKKAQAWRDGSPPQLVGPILSLTPPKTRLSAKHCKARQTMLFSQQVRPSSRLTSLQALFSPLTSPRPQAQVMMYKSKPLGLSLGKQGSGIDHSVRKKEKKSKTSKTKARSGRSTDKIDASHSLARDFWAKLTTLKQGKPLEIDTSRKSAMVNKSVLGIGFSGKIRGSTREAGLSERITGETSLAKSMRKFTERSDWSVKKSALLSPSSHNLKTYIRKERPNNSDLTTKIREVMKKNGLASSSRIRNKVNSEVSAISLVGLEEQFKYHQSKMLTKSKVSLLGMKVDKLIKAVQESNAKVQNKTLNDYLGFDKFSKKSTPTTPAKSSKRVLNHKREVMYSFPDYNMCQPANYKSLLLRQHSALLFSKRLVIKKTFMPRQIILSKDANHLPEVRCFVRHPDKPDSRPIFKLLLSMMPAKDSERPTVQEPFKLRLKTAVFDKDHSDLPSTCRQTSYQCILPMVESKITFSKSKIHLTKSSEAGEAMDNPNSNLRIVLESPSHVGNSSHFSFKRETGQQESGSGSNIVQSEATRVLSPFTSPIVHQQEAKNKLAAFRQLKLKSLPKDQELGQSKPDVLLKETGKFPETEPLNESNLRRLLSAKKALLKVSTEQTKDNSNKLILSGLPKDQRNLQQEGGSETPKFIDSPKANSKPLNLLASLKHLKSTLPKKNFLN